MFDGYTKIIILKCNRTEIELKLTDQSVDRWWGKIEKMPGTNETDCWLERSGLAILLNLIGCIRPSSADMSWRTGSVD